MSIKKTSEQGWLSKIGDSIKGVLIGSLLFLFAIPIIFFNECSAVDRAQDLEAGQGTLVRVQADDIDSANEGKLIHVSGDVKVSGLLIDDKFAVSAKVLELKRDVEMYQWKEKANYKSKEASRGNTNSGTKYTYKKTWSSTLINSSRFKEDGHDNPKTIPFESKTFSAKTASLGDYKLGAEIAARVGSLEPYRLKKSNVKSLPNSLDLKLYDGALYQAKSPDSPKIGDVRISYRARKAGSASVIAGQYGQSIRPFTSELLNEPLVLVADDDQSAEQMFQAAQASNTMMAWVLRLVTFLMMCGGLVMVLRPIGAAVDVIPFIGNLIGTGITLVAFLIATPIWFFCVASAWVVARPLLGIALIVGGIVAATLLVLFAVKNGAKRAVAVVKS